jgi:hypothetical protein
LRASPESKFKNSSFIESDSHQISVTKDLKQFDKVEQGEVAKIFKDSIFLERELESAKIEIALKPDFNLLDMFRILDPTSKGYIS